MAKKKIVFVSNQTTIQWTNNKHEWFEFLFPIEIDEYNRVVHLILITTWSITTYVVEWLRFVLFCFIFSSQAAIAAESIENVLFGSLENI